MRVRQGLAAVAFLAACAPTTTLGNSWKDPAAAPARFNKVLAVCICRDASFRRTVEDELARLIPRSQPAYTLISDEQLRERDAAKAGVKQAGFDGVVVMRLINVDRTATYVPGQPYAVAAPYASMWEGWGYGWNTVYDPGYVREDQYVDFDTNVYSVPDEKLLWAGRTQTQNPQSVPGLVDEVVQATAQEMKRQKVFAD